MINSADENMLMQVITTPTTHDNTKRAHSALEVVLVLGYYSNGENCWITSVVALQGT